MNVRVAGVPYTRTSGVLVRSHLAACDARRCYRYIRTPSFGSRGPHDNRATGPAGNVRGNEADAYALEWCRTRTCWWAAGHPTSRPNVRSTGPFSLSTTIEQRPMVKCVHEPLVRQSTTLALGVATQKRCCRRAPWPEQHVSCPLLIG